jgi:hypothetical protein
MMQVVHHCDAIVIYVAPTIKLCQQVERDLVKRLVEDGMKKSKAEGKTIGIYSQPHQGKGNIQQTLRFALEGRRDADGVTYNAITMGTVVIMTHQGFFSLPGNVFSDSLRKKIRVFFDEAKKPVFSLAPLKLNSERAEDLFKQVFKFRPYKDTNFKHITLAKHYKIPLTELRGLLERQAKISLSNLISAASNSRIEVFLSSKRTPQGLQFFQLRLPSRVFEGFEEVTLMSAFFEDSQLFYLLQSDPGIKLNNINAQLENYPDQRLMVNTRYSHVTIVPLTTQKNVISKTSLRSMLIPGAGMSKIQARFEELGITSSDHVPIMRYLLQGHTPANTPKHQAEATSFLRKIKGLESSPIIWYMKQAKRVIKAWKEKYEPSDRKVDRPLMFVNKVYEKEVDTRFFHQVSTSAHGLNQYRHSNVAVFLAAINPDPQLASFLKARIGDEYDIQRDYVLDACIQSLGRCSVRQGNLRDPILIILPDMKLTKMVMERMSDMPIVRTNVAVQLGDMVSFSVRTFNNVKRENKEREAGGKKELKKQNQQEKYSKWLSNPLNKELANIRSKKSYYTRKLRGNPRDKNAKLSLLELEKELKHLLKKR